MRENCLGVNVGMQAFERIVAEWRIYVSVNFIVQIMACRLVGAKPLSEPMTEYFGFDP